MRIGIVSQWRNQGQATLSRHLRDALIELGHDTFVLARPTREQHVLPGKIDHDDVWKQPGVEDASRYEIPTDEYLDWANRNRIEVCFFNQNYQWKQLEKLRTSGVKNVGYFVWEWFENSNLDDTRAAYDVVYSLNRSTQARYARLGYESPLLFWGIHPELLAVQPRKRDGVRFFFPGGLLGPRKPIRAVVEAFRRARGDHLRLVLKAQLESPLAESYDAANDPRIISVVDDVDQSAYYDLFASCHVSLGVSRWEGTGLHFFESIAFAMPQIVNDVPPMNEHVEHDVDGRLVQSHVVGATKSGIPSHDPDVADLARAIEAYADRATLERHTRAIEARRDAMPWRRTVTELAALLRRLG
jgi:1,2-diacylglycerol 3-alpha-glucosyltransferase